MEGSGTAGCGGVGEKKWHHWTVVTRGKVKGLIYVCPPALRAELGPGFKKGFANSLLSE